MKIILDYLKLMYFSGHVFVVTNTDMKYFGMVENIIPVTIHNMQILFISWILTFPTSCNLQENNKYVLFSQLPHIRSNAYLSKRPAFSVFGTRSLS